MVTKLLLFGCEACEFHLQIWRIVIQVSKASEMGLIYQSGVVIGTFFQMWYQSAIFYGKYMFQSSASLLQV